jgi:hypothetical protein
MSEGTDSGTNGDSLESTNLCIGTDGSPEWNNVGLSSAWALRSIIQSDSQGK